MQRRETVEKTKAKSAEACALTKAGTTDGDGTGYRAVSRAQAGADQQDVTPSSPTPHADDTQANPADASQRHIGEAGEASAAGNSMGGSGDGDGKPPGGQKRACVHEDAWCFLSGVGPIVGTRYHLTGQGTSIATFCLFLPAPPAFPAVCVPPPLSVRAPSSPLLPLHWLHVCARMQNPTQNAC